MRQSAITLTMDTYGHLLPGDEAVAVSKMGSLLGCVVKALDHESSEIAQLQAQQSACCAHQVDSALCGNDDTTAPQVKEPKPLADKNLCEKVLLRATESESRAARTRTGNQRIMSQELPTRKAPTDNDLRHGQ